MSARKKAAKKDDEPRHGSQTPPAEANAEWNDLKKWDITTIVTTAGKLPQHQSILHAITSSKLLAVKTKRKDVSLATARNLAKTFGVYIPFEGAGVFLKNKQVSPPSVCRLLHMMLANSWQLLPMKQLNSSSNWKPTPFSKSWIHPTLNPSTNERIFVHLWKSILDMVENPLLNLRNEEGHPAAMIMMSQHHQTLQQKMNSTS